MKTLIFTSLVALAAVSVVFGLRPGMAKITNGAKAVDGQFGYDVRLVINNMLQCGGSILNEKWILTAAHCLFPLLPITIKAQIGFLNIKDTDSTNGGYVVNMERYVIHPLFNRLTFWNDIALIRVRETIRLNETNSRPIKLPHRERVDYNGSAIATGWGRVKENGNMSDDLLWARIPFTSNVNCSAQYPGMFNPIFMVCAGGGGEDTCQGDSGGPLALINVLIGKSAPVQVGIVSTGKSCGSKDATIYTRLSTYVGWIEGIINRDSSGTSTTKRPGIGILESDEQRVENP